MKNGLLIWNVLLTLVSGFLLFSHFSGGKSGAKKNGSKNGGDTASASLSFRMAYFELDSVEANYKYVQDVKSEIARKEENFNNEMKRLDQVYKNKYDELVKNGFSSQADQDNAQATLNQLAEKLKAQKQGLETDLQNFVVKSNLEVKKEIEKFIKNYNTPQKYTYILSYEPGFLYYMDTTLNITKDVIKGLNNTYKPGVKK